MRACLYRPPLNYRYFRLIVHRVTQVITGNANQEVENCSQFTTSYRYVVRAFLSNVEGVCRRSRAIRFFCRLFARYTCTRSFLVVANETTSVVVSIITGYRMRRTAVTRAFCVHSVLTGNVSIFGTRRSDLFPYFFRATRVDKDVYCVCNYAILNGRLLCFIRSTIYFNDDNQWNFVNAFRLLRMDRRSNYIRVSFHRLVRICRSFLIANNRICSLVRRRKDITV